MAALAISHILKLPIVGTYHTSLPQYAGYLTDDSAIEELMWKYVLWYYDQMDSVYVPSKSRGDELACRGVSPSKIRLFPRGVDTERFHPSKRDLQFLQQYADVDTFKLLCVGRVAAYFAYLWGPSITGFLLFGAIYNLVALECRLSVCSASDFQSPILHR